MSEQPEPAEPEILPNDLESQDGYKYEWSKLADGQARRLIRGTHFHCTARSFRVNAYQYARRRNWPPPFVDISDDGNEIELQLRRHKAKKPQQVKRHRAGSLEVEIRQSVNSNVTIRIRSTKDERRP